jgi:hypothetical protein
MSLPAWEVVSWEFVSDSEPGSDRVFVNRENSSSREWAGPALMSGRVTVHVRRGTEPRTFQTHFTVTPRPSRWKEMWSFRQGDSMVSQGSAPPSVPTPVFEPGGSAAGEPFSPPPPMGYLAMSLIELGLNTFGDITAARDDRLVARDDRLVTRDDRLVVRADGLP